MISMCQFTEPPIRDAEQCDSDAFSMKNQKNKENQQHIWKHCFFFSIIFTILCAFWSRFQLFRVDLLHHLSTLFPPLPADCTVVQPGKRSCCTAADGHQCRTVVCDARYQSSGTALPVGPKQPRCCRVEFNCKFRQSCK